MELDALAEIMAIRPVLKSASEKFILPRFRKLKKEEIVRDGNPEKLVTLADVEASRYVLEWCRKRLPGSFGEEEIGDERFRHDALWCLDPVDGTEEFRQGKDGFCIQASLLSKSPDSDSYCAAGGMIYLPLSGLFVYATEEHGPVWEKGGKTGMVAPVKEHGGLKAAVREIDPGRKLADFFAYAKEKGILFSQAGCGGAGHTFASMLLQKPSSPNVLIFNRDFSKEWDLSPAANALERAGWSLCDMEGEEFAYNRKDPVNRMGFVAAPKARIGEVLGAIKSYGASKLLEPMQ